MLLLAVLACQSPDKPAPDTGLDTGTDTADSGTGSDSADTGLVGADWPPLDEDPAWESDGRGYATGLAWADLDRDGDAELIVAYGNDMDPGPLLVYDNDGGVLNPLPSWRSADEAYYGHLSTGDVDGDGDVDVAVSRFLGDGRFAEPGGVQVFLNDGGALEDTPAWEASGFFSFSCALGDVDRDGDLDLAVAVGESYRNDPDRSRVFVNDGAGGFGDAAAWETEADRHSFDVAWADFDGDGWLDLVFANVETGHTLYHNDGGALEATPAWTAAGDGFEGNTLDWGDVDGDGWLDLAVTDNDQLGGAGAVRVWCGPDLEVCWESADEWRYPSAVSLEDADGDGDLDLFAGAWWGPVRGYENQGGALESEASLVLGSADMVVEALAWEDVDGSGARVRTISGEGLVAVPRRGRVLAVTGGVAGDGVVTGPGAVSAVVVVSGTRDLAVSDWEPEHGEWIYTGR